MYVKFCETIYVLNMKLLKCTIKKQLAILKAVEETSSVKAISKIYNILERTIRDWRQEKAKLEKCECLYILNDNTNRIMIKGLDRRSWRSSVYIYKYSATHTIAQPPYTLKLFACVAAKKWDARKKTKPPPSPRLHVSALLLPRFRV